MSIIDSNQNGKAKGQAKGMDGPEGAAAQIRDAKVDVSSKGQKNGGKKWKGQFKGHCFNCGGWGKTSDSISSRTNKGSNKTQRPTVSQSRSISLVNQEGKQKDYNSRGYTYYDIYWFWHTNDHYQ